MSFRTRRLAFVSHRFECNDGQGRVNYEIVKAALEDGYHVTVLATRCAPEIATHPLAQYIHVGNDKLPTAIVRNLVFARSSARWLRDHRHEYDIVQVNGFVTWERGDVAAAHFVHTSWKQNRYYPFRGLSPYHLYQRIFTHLNAHWEKTVFKTAQCVVAVSSLVGEELKKLGVAPDRIAIIYNGVDTEQFRPGVNQRPAFGLPSHVPLALFVGDIRTPRKNLETLLRAMQTVQSVHLVVAGAVEGSPYPELARKLRVDNRVRFVGKITEMAALMRSVDLFVFPSRYDPFGLVALEAMSSGVPVIVSATAGIADYVGDAGEILDDPEDFQRLSELMTELVSSPSKRALMGEQGRHRALEMQWGQMTRKYLTLYKEILQTAPEESFCRKAE
jgi:glycosyltransferase involved in cell wall biosynthesis